MKTKIQTGLPIFSPSFARLLLPVLIAICSSSASATGSQSWTAEPKTHTLFMGADIFIEQGQKLYRVQDVAGTSFVITVDGKEVRVPMDRGLSKFKIKPALKLATVSANVTNLQGKRVFTAANDPTAKFQRGLSEAQLQYADSQYAQHLASDILQNVENKPIPPDSGSNKFKEVKAQQVAQATLVLNAAEAGPGTNFHNDGSVLNSDEAFDAIEVSFDVSADKPLSHPYALIIAQYHARGDMPEQTGSFVYARSLNPIDRETTQVHVEQGGLPAGFELKDVQLHLFNQGQEVASTVAAKRVALTSEEAFQYLLVEYVSSHKGATLPPTPLMGKLPADFPTRLADNQFQQVYYVRVDKAGRAFAAYADESCSQKIDNPYLESVVQAIRFNPALEKGKPVDGVAPLKLRDLPI